MKKLFGVLLLAVSSHVWAQSTPCNNTFVKQMDGIGITEPRVFRDPVNPLYFLTATNGGTTFISGVNAAGTVTWTRAISFPGDVGTITDMIVDQNDGTLAGIVKGNNSNYMFKYDYTTSTFNWVRKYPVNYLFFNIHQVDPNRYVVTGAILSSQVTIFDVVRTTGAMAPNFQRGGVTGEFFSTYDAPSNSIYGACRYYSSGSLFNPSLFQYSPNTGMNSWIKTYIDNTPGGTCRIYPVAPIVDGNEIVQLSSGDPTINFNTYTTGPTGVWLLKTDLAGNPMWTNQINIPGYTQLNAKKIINTATGYYLLIDSYNGSSSIIDYFFVVKTDKNGKVQWANRYGISGQNTVIAGVEDNGYIYLTALSQSYSVTSPFLFLKLNTLGMSDAACPYIRPMQAFESNYNNIQASKPTPTNPTTYGNGLITVTQAPKGAKEKIHCSTTCPPPTSLPCSTLSGTLSTGVIAFYPFGNGSLSDLSGNGYNLINPTAAVPTVDRNGSQNCAYRFSGTDFLTTPAGGSAFLNNITNTPFSISIWYQPLNTRPVGNYELLIGRGNTPLHCPDTWGEWSLGLYDCRKAVAGADMYSHWETTSMSCNQFMTFISNSWHHIALVYDGTNYTIYRDGIPSTTSSGPCGPGTFNIGEMMLGVDYDGDLDDIVIYNRVLSTSEVLTLFHVPGSCCDGVTSSVSKPFIIPEHGTAIKVYPNPTDGKISVSAGRSIIRTVSVISNTGQVLNTYQFDAKEVSVNMKHLAAGTYFIKVNTDSGTTTEKVIKK